MERISVPARKSVNRWPTNAEIYKKTQAIVNKLACLDEELFATVPYREHSAEYVVDDQVAYQVDQYDVNEDE